MLTNSTSLQVNNNDKTYIFLAIKAAALQGNKAHYHFLRNIQKNLFLPTVTDDTVEQMVRRYAENANSDVDELKRDILSYSAKKAYQYDGKYKQDINVRQILTLV